MKARISALMDGELGRAQMHKVMARLADDAALRRQWALYHVIGDSLRGEAPATMDVVERIERRLAAEPDHRRWSGRKRATMGMADALAVAVLLASGSDGDGRVPVSAAALALREDLRTAPAVPVTARAAADKNSPAASADRALT